MQAIFVFSGVVFKRVLEIFEKFEVLLKKGRKKFRSQFNSIGHSILNRLFRSHAAANEARPLAPILFLLPGHGSASYDHADGFGILLIRHRSDAGREIRGAPSSQITVLLNILAKLYLNVSFSRQSFPQRPRKRGK